MTPIGPQRFEEMGDIITVERTTSCKLCVLKYFFPQYISLIGRYRQFQLPQVLDAIRRHDGLVVCIKMIQDYRKLRQIKITEYFSTRRMTEDSRNHVVPLYDVFVDALTPHIQYMVMPVLRRFDDPEFITVGEVVEFISQVLEVRRSCSDFGYHLTHATRA